MLAIFLTLGLLSAAAASEASLNRSDLLCSGRPYYNVTMAAYYPDFASDDESDYVDAKGKKLRTLQDYIDGRTEYVTVAMDLSSGIAYGTNVCVPELNEHFGRRIPFQVRDYGDRLSGKKFSRLDVCVRSEADSYDNAVNRPVTIYV